MGKPKIKPLTVERQYPMGVYIGGGVRVPHYAYVLYEARMSDGSTQMIRGTSVHSGGTIRPTKESKRARELRERTDRPDLSAQMTAAAVLLERIEYACLDADGMLVDPQTLRPRKAKR